MVLPTHVFQDIRSAFYKVCKQNESFTSCSLQCFTHWIFTNKMKIQHGVCHAVITVKYKVRHLHSTMWVKFYIICSFIFDEGSMSKSNPNEISSVIIISQSSLLHKLQKWKPETIFFSRRIRDSLIFECTIIFPLPFIPFTTILSALLQIFQ